MTKNSFKIVILASILLYVGYGATVANAIFITPTHPLPTITSVDLTSITAGSGTFTITVNGSNFVNYGSSVVRFNGVTVMTYYNSSSQLKAFIPAWYIQTPGTFDITVFTYAPGGGVSNPVLFTVMPAPTPTITDINPTSYALDYNPFILTINGDGFTYNSRVMFSLNGVPIYTSPAIFFSPNQLKVFMVAASNLKTAGIFNVSVTNANGTSNEIPFTVTVNQPVINFLQPNSGPVGTQVTIMGSGFTFMNNQVVFNGNNIGSFNSFGGSTITFTVPQDIFVSCPPPPPGGVSCYSITRNTITPGNYFVSVTNTNGTSNEIPFTVTATQLVINSLQPNFGPAGTRVTITGIGFTSIGNKIKFGNLGTENSFAYNLSSFDGRTITFTVPNNGGCFNPLPFGFVCDPFLVLPGTYDVSIINANGTSNSQTFTVTTMPITSCLPFGITLDTVASIDIGGANKVTVGQTLNSLGASCNNYRLVDSNNKSIMFYYVTGCWANPPYNYQQILNQQNQTIQNLRNYYTVITLTCNPLGIMAQ